jgi:LuxR family maltose regulon positive regulatory protein
MEPGHQPLLEVLSQRELEILNLFASNQSSREIAEQLFISPGTVKRHAHNILGKLAVNSRRDAVSKASGLGILKNT